MQPTRRHFLQRISPGVTASQAPRERLSDYYGIIGKTFADSRKDNVYDRPARSEDDNARDDAADAVRTNAGGSGMHKGHDSNDGRTANIQASLGLLCFRHRD